MLRDEQGAVGVRRPVALMMGRCVLTYCIPGIGCRRAHSHSLGHGAAPRRRISYGILVMAQPFVGAWCHTAILVMAYQLWHSLLLRHGAAPPFRKALVEAVKRSTGTSAQVRQACRQAQTRHSVKDPEGPCFLFHFSAEPRALDRSRPFWSTGPCLVGS